jgi:hypothetical protein
MVSAAYPVGPREFRFFHSPELPYERVELHRSPLRSRAVTLAEPIARGLTRLFPKQCNAVAMVALKPKLPDELWPWLTVENGEIVFDRGYARDRFKGDGGR